MFYCLYPLQVKKCSNYLRIYFKNFIWGKKHPKFRKEIIETLPGLGGLKMTNIWNFDAALRLSWAKRLISMDEGWGEFLRKYGICNIFRFGDEYPLKLSKTMNNKFWKHFLMSLHNLNNHLKYNNA